MSKPQGEPGKDQGASSQLGKGRFYLSCAGAGTGLGMGQEPGAGALLCLQGARWALAGSLTCLQELLVLHLCLLHGALHCCVCRGEIP